MLGYFFSLFPLFGYGVSDYCASKLSKNSHPATITFIFSLFSIVVSISLLLVYGLNEITLKSFSIFLIAAVISNTAFILFVSALKISKTGVVTPIANAYTVVTLLIVIFIQSKSISPLQIILTLSIVIGISFITYSREKGVDYRHHNKAIILSLASMTLFGIVFVVFDIAGRDQEWHQNVILFQTTNIIVSFFVMITWLRNKWLISLKEIFKVKYSYVGFITNTSGNIGFFIAISLVDNVGIPAAVGSASPLITTFLSRKLDGENIDWLQKAGLVVITAGVVGLSLV